MNDQSAAMGIIEAIHIAPAAAAPMEAVGEVALLIGVGIEGDRYAGKAGTFSTWPKDHEVTLIEGEEAEAAGLTFGESRRNITTRGLRLNPLVGNRFRVGGALLEGTRLCEPCAYLERLTGQAGLAKTLAGRGGLRAVIVEGGVVRVGDAVVPLPSE